MIIYDFEVFRKDWLAVFLDLNERTEQVIINDRDELHRLYQKHVDDIWIGFNNRHYDQYIFKGILLEMDPKYINDKIIVDKEEGWRVVPAARKIPMINYDVMPSGAYIGLKTMEGFMGSMIKESDVDFNLDRKLTNEEIEETVKYCRHDVEETFRLFTEQIDVFNAMYGIVKAFPDRVYLSDIGLSEAQITARVLDCQRQSYSDEFDYYFLPCLRISKYRQVMQWFREVQISAKSHEFNDKKAKQNWYKKQNLNISVAGIPHSFGFGGLHGAADHPIHVKGRLLHVDVNNYYPSLLIAHGLVTRSAGNDNYQKVYRTRKSLKMQQVAAAHAGDKAKAKELKKAQLPYKKMLNALSGAMKDENNPAYDPRNNNIMCINGQLMLLDLIEHLEAVPGMGLIQSNTDGLIIKIPDTDEAFDQVDDVCWEWEKRMSTADCSILLELDNISEIYQKDVNNYLWMNNEGDVERIGAYVKPLSAIDNDLPIVNKAIVEYMINKTPVETTIRECDEFIQFQKIIKLTGNYDHMEREYHGGEIYREIHHRDGTTTPKWRYSGREKFGNSKTFRVFASKYVYEDGRLLKFKVGGRTGEKCGNTPNHCFVYLDSVVGVKCPDKLDKQWYIDIAKERLRQYGLEVR